MKWLKRPVAKATVKLIPSHIPSLAATRSERSRLVNLPANDWPKVTAMLVRRLLMSRSLTPPSAPVAVPGSTVPVSYTHL